MVARSARDRDAVDAMMICCMMAARGSSRKSQARVLVSLVGNQSPMTLKTDVTKYRTVATP